MPLSKDLTRKKMIPGSLGALGKSVGYLQGGYRGTVWTSIQYFNTSTNAGKIVYDSGVQRSYVPGVNGRLAGYFSIDDSSRYNSFNFVTNRAASSFSVSGKPQVTCSDAEVASESWLLTGSDWIKLDMTTVTPTSYGNLSSGPTMTSRQAGSISTHGLFSNTSDTCVYSLQFATKSVVNQGATQILNGNMQIVAGMESSDTRVYFVGFTPYTIQINFVGGRMTSYRYAQSTFTYQFGESHSLSSPTTGYMMAGYNDTTGRYGGTQHGLCQSIAFATETINTLADLVLPQSSGQMMQGF